MSAKGSDETATRGRCVGSFILQDIRSVYVVLFSTWAAKKVGLTIAH